MDTFYQKLIALSALLNIVVACDSQSELKQTSTFVTDNRIAHSQTYHESVKTIELTKSTSTCRQVLSSCVATNDNP